MDGLDELFDGGGSDRQVIINEPKYKVDINFSWLVWLALFAMIVFFRGDPDLHDATIDYIMHKNHKSWIELYRDYDHHGHKWSPKDEVNNKEVDPNELYYIPHTEF